MEVALLCMPTVKMPGPDHNPLYDNDAGKAAHSRRAQQRGVRFSTWCCGQINRKCNDKAGDGACPGCDGDAGWDPARHPVRVPRAPHAPHLRAQLVR